MHLLVSKRLLSCVLFCIILIVNSNSFEIQCILCVGVLAHMLYMDVSTLEHPLLGLSVMELSSSGLVDLYVLGLFVFV